MALRSQMIDVGSGQPDRGTASAEPSVIGEFDITRFIAIFVGARDHRCEVDAELGLPITQGFVPIEGGLGVDHALGEAVAVVLNVYHQITLRHLRAEQDL